MQHLEVVHRHLQDLCLLQFGGALLLECGGHEAPQLGETGVDAVSAALLDNAAPLLARQHLTAVRAVTGRPTTAQHNIYFRDQLSSLNGKLENHRTNFVVYSLLEVLKRN